MNTIIISFQALATVVIAIYAYSNYKLSKTIKNENQKLLKHLIVSNIVDSSFSRFKSRLDEYEKFLKEFHPKSSS